MIFEAYKRSFRNLCFFTGRSCHSLFSRPKYNEVYWSTKFCILCSNSNNFRVLECGHPFCYDCLELLYDTVNEISCPCDGKKCATSLRNLPTPHNFNGDVIKCFTTTREPLSKDKLSRLVDNWIEELKMAISCIEEEADKMDTHEYRCAIAKIPPSIVSIAGSVVAIVGFGLTISVVLAPVGVPMLVSGSAVGASAGATSTTTNVVETCLLISGAKKAQEHINECRLKGMQIHLLEEKQKSNPEQDEYCCFDESTMINGMRVVPTVGKLVIGGAAARTVVTTGAHVTGIVFSGVLIALDLAQIVCSSIRIHTGNPSDHIKKLKEAAAKLKTQLRSYLVGQDCFQLIYTADDKWAYIEMTYEQMTRFKKMRKNVGITLDELRHFGAIVKSGDGKQVPADIEKEMEDEWFSHYAQMVVRD